MDVFPDEFFEKERVVANAKWEPMVKPTLIDDLSGSPVVFGILVLVAVVVVCVFTALARG